MPRSVPDDLQRVSFPSGEEIEPQDLSSFLEQYRPMSRLLSSPDLEWLSRERYAEVAHFRRERAAIYFQYLRELRSDLRALPLWAAPQDAETFIELDKASWTVQMMLLKLALAGVLYYFGIPRRDSGVVERSFEKLQTLLSAAA